MALPRNDWLDLARKVDWTYRYASERDIFPQALSGAPWLPHDEAWADWSEVYRTSYGEYMRNQSAKDLFVLAVRDALNRPRSHYASTQPGYSWSSFTKALSL